MVSCEYQKHNSVRKVLRNIISFLNKKNLTIISESQDRLLQKTSFSEYEMSKEATVVPLENLKEQEQASQLPTNPNQQTTQPHSNNQEEQIKSPDRPYPSQAGLEPDPENRIAHGEHPTQLNMSPEPFEEQDLTNNNLVFDPVLQRSKQFRSNLMIVLNVLVIMLLLTFFVIIAMKLDLRPIGKKGKVYLFETAEGTTTVTQYFSNRKKYYFSNSTTRNNAHTKCLQQRMTEFGTVVKVCDNRGLQVIVDIFALFAGITTTTNKSELLRASMDTTSSREDIMTANRLLTQNTANLAQSQNILNTSTFNTVPKTMIQLMSSNLMTYYFNHTTKAFQSTDLHINRLLQNTTILWTNHVLESAIKNLTKEISSSLTGIKRILEIFDIPSETNDQKRESILKFQPIKQQTQMLIIETEYANPSHQALAEKCYIEPDTHSQRLLFKCPFETNNEEVPGQISILYAFQQS